MLTTHKSVLGLDVGAKRIGIAAASLVARLPHPLVTLSWDDNFFAALKELVETEDAGTLVIGFPRGMQGQHTAQTGAIEAFTEELRRHFDLPVHLQDEALTSKQAEEELDARGKPYERGDIDALAATYILQDWLDEHQETA